MSTAHVISNGLVRDRLGFLHPKSAVNEANIRRRELLEQLIAVHGEGHPLVIQLEKSIVAFELMVQEQTEPQHHSSVRLCCIESDGFA